MEIIQQIKLTLNQKGIDNKSLSELTGWSQNQIRRIFNGAMTVKELYILMPIIEKEIKLI